MPLEKPDKFPDWATDNQHDPISGQLNVVEPPSAMLESGWNREQIPPRQWFNWWMRFVGQWVRWFEEKVSSLLSDTNELQQDVSAIEDDVSAIEDENAKSLLIRQNIVGRSWVEGSSGTTPQARFMSVAWSPELEIFVAIADQTSEVVFTELKVMTSKDGIYWSLTEAASDALWQDIVWSPELGIFVAVAQSAGIGNPTNNRVMTSPDGINWTIRECAADANRKSWQSVTWSPELGIFVAVSGDAGMGDVMTSPDGINWTARTAAENLQWRSVTWSPELSMFVAVGNTSTARIMTSPNGIDWTSTPPPVGSVNWASVVWSPELGIFVAIGMIGMAMISMVSENGHSWSYGEYIDATSSTFLGLAWSPELKMFMAVGKAFAATSIDGLKWSFKPHGNEEWIGVTWSPELSMFVVVGDTVDLTTARTL